MSKYLMIGGTMHGTRMEIPDALAEFRVPVLPSEPASCARVDTVNAEPFKTQVYDLIPGSGPDGQLSMAIERDLLRRFDHIKFSQLYSFGGLTVEQLENRMEQWCNENLSN